MVKAERSEAEMQAQLELRLKFGTRVKQRREKLGLSQNDLAVKLRVTPSAVAQWELGKNGPQMRTFNELVAILGVSGSWLSAGSENIFEDRVLELIRELDPQDQPLVIDMIEVIIANRNISPMLQAPDSASATVVTANASDTTSVPRTETEAKFDAEDEAVPIDRKKTTRRGRPAKGTHGPTKPLKARGRATTQRSRANSRLLSAAS